MTLAILASKCGTGGSSRLLVLPDRKHEHGEIGPFTSSLVASAPSYISEQPNERGLGMSSQETRVGCMTDSSRSEVLTRKSSSHVTRAPLAAIAVSKHQTALSTSSIRREGQRSGNVSNQVVGVFISVYATSLS
jgi:hypothetical protein